MKRLRDLAVSIAVHRQAILLLVVESGTRENCLLTVCYLFVESGTYDVICQFCTVKGMVVESEVLKAQNCALSKFSLPMHCNVVFFFLSFFNVRAIFVDNKLKAVKQALPSTVQHCCFDFHLIKSSCYFVFQICKSCGFGLRKHLFFQNTPQKEVQKR